eukprot:gene5018-8616_t
MLEVQKTEQNVKNQADEWISIENVITTNRILLSVLSFMLPGTGHYLIGQKQKGKALMFLNICLRMLLFVPLIGLVATVVSVSSAIIVISDVKEMLARLESGEKIEPGECSNEKIMFGLAHFIAPHRVILKEKKS